ncbi:hypothetical protein [Roseofilum sp. Guam]|nr:hypothetical protein [Roseofilum sp. Guam]
MMYVFDTNIWVAGLRSRRGASLFSLKPFVNDGLYQPFLKPYF